MVKGRDLRSEGQVLVPGRVYWMDIFSHIFVVKIVMKVV